MDTKTNITSRPPSYLTIWHVRRHETINSTPLPHMKSSYLTTATFVLALTLFFELFDADTAFTDICLIAILATAIFPYLLFQRLTQLPLELDTVSSSFPSIYYFSFLFFFFHLLSPFSTKLLTAFLFHSCIPLSRSLLLSFPPFLPLLFHAISRDSPISLFFPNYILNKIRTKKYIVTMAWTGKSDDERKARFFLLYLFPIAMQT